MQVFILRVDVPNKGLACPLRTDEGIFAPHKIDIAEPEQLVVMLLGNEGEDVQTE